MSRSPQNISNASCAIVGNFTDDRASFDEQVDYTYDTEKSRLRISVGQKPDDSYFQIAPNLIIGTNVGQLSSIFIDKFEIE